MLVIAQRWVTGTPSEDFGRPVVEALVIAPEGSGGTLYSAFYDANAGHGLGEAFDWWNRGRTGVLPHLAINALEVLSKWSLPADQATDLKTYVERLEALTQQVREAVSSAV